LKEIPSNILYDEVHAIMIKKLLAFFKQDLKNIELEVPYNFYGNRGSVDLVKYEVVNILGMSH